MKVSDILAWVDEAIATIDADERYHYPTATIDVNAPLALIQVSFEAQISVLKRLKAEIEKEVL